MGLIDDIGPGLRRHVQDRPVLGGTVPAGKVPPCCISRDRLGIRPFGRVREEALQVAQPVPSIAPRVDPVVVEAPGVTPCPDRVRMHAQDLGGLRHGERRVGRSRVERGERGHRALNEDL